MGLSKNSNINLDMGSFNRYRMPLKWLSGLLVVLVLIAAGVLAWQSVFNIDPRDEVVGRWRTPAGTTTVEFFEDGTAVLEGREVSFELNYDFVDDSQIRMYTDSVEEIWSYEATSETLRLTSATDQRFSKIQVIDWRFARRILPDMLKGLKVTVQATFISFLLALLFGFVFALGRRSQSRLISFPSGAIVEFIRSTPLLIQLFFFFFVLPRYGLRIPAFQTGVLAIGLHYGTYCSEVYRAGIEGVEQGQWEAAIALNLSPERKWLAIILPQAMPPMIPAFGNYFVALFKETAQLSVLAIAELLSTAGNAGTENFRFLEPITMAGLLYFAVSFPSSLIVQRLEKRFGHKE
jgi:polar amino acid transport system permease protein